MMLEDTVIDVSLINYLGDRRYPRGMRNNNPFNIRIGSNAWRGKLPTTERTDRSFEQFRYYWQGIRAGVIVLRTYYFKHKLTTVEKIINRFAPPVENATESYVQMVCKGTGFKARETFEWNRQNVNLLVREICRHENGRDPLISDNLFAYVWLDLNP